MNSPLPFFNWSLRKLLATEPGSFNRARIKILFLFLLLALLKVSLVISVSWYHEQHIQLARAAILFVIYIVLLKILLYNKDSIKAITHFTIWLGVLVVVSGMFFMNNPINIVVLQFIFMLILSSFYLIDQRFGIFYSCLCVLPVIGYLIIFGLPSTELVVPREELDLPTRLTIIVLNFITIVAAHYFYHQAFQINIAEKELLNSQLQEAVEKANRNARAKSDFLSTMSHELRTPLNSVIGMTELLLHDPHSEEQKENLEILQFSAGSLHTLINDILDFNKLDSEKILLEKIPVNLQSLMKNIYSGLEIQAKEKGLKLVLQVDDVLNTHHVITDPMRITQIIYNLAGNGIKFTHEGGVTITLKVLEQDNDMIRIRFTIADTGIGINPDKHTAIFEPFVQESSHTTRHFGGTGLGLAIVKRLLELFHSAISMKSSPGKGSEFLFDISFPLDKERVAQKAERLFEENALSGLRVLVAEDNRMNIFLIQKLGQKWDIKLDVAENGIAVLDMLKSAIYDVILMDIHMPEMDGYETTKEIRMLPDKRQSEIPIIAVTASVTHELDERIRKAGMDDYVRKPFNSGELYTKLRSIALS
jgi:signal transduction histidine kinase